MESTILSGQLMALSVALLSAISSNLFSKIGERMTSDMLAYVRMFFAVPLVLLYALLADHGLVLGSSWQTNVSVAASGIIGFFFCDIFMFKSIVDLGPRETSVIMTLNPAITAFMAFFLLGETLTGVQVVGMALTLLGIALMIYGEKVPSQDRGRAKVVHAAILCAFAAAILQSVADITAKFTLSDIPYVSSNALRIVSGFLVWVIFGFFRWKGSFQQQSHMVKDVKLMTMMALAVALGPVVGAALSMGAMTRAPAAIVRSLVQTSPILMLPIDIFIRKRKVSVLSFIGTIISVVGVIVLL